MNTYLVPVVEGVKDPFIIKVIAKGYKEAQEKIKLNRLDEKLEKLYKEFSMLY